jgi:limonene-1,2-epoxide hydrolase
VPRRLTADRNTETIQALLEALRDRDRDRVLALLTSDVEAVGQKGTFRGAEAVADWARPSDDGHLRSNVEVDEIRALPGDRVAVAARRQWRWVDDPGELADEHPFGVLFELEDGRVARWRQDFDSIVDAIDSIPPG